MSAILSMFAGAVIVLMERSWRMPPTDERVVALEVPKSSSAILQAVAEASAQLGAMVDAHRERKSELDRAVRELLLAPAPGAVVHVVRQ